VFQIGLIDNPGGRYGLVVAFERFDGLAQDQAAPRTTAAVGSLNFRRLDWITRGRVLLRGDAGLGR
jgi:hypothetical protein